MQKRWATRGILSEVALTLPGTLRQFRYPKAYRIHKVNMPIRAREVQEFLNKVLDDTRTPLTATPAPPLPTSPIDESFIVDLGTKLWRVDKRVEQVANRDESLEIERLARRFEELREAILQGVDIEIHDYTGQRYDVGLTVSVLTYQPTADITTGDEVIIETVKPTMYHHGSLISPGEVVVGVPLVEGDKAEDAM